MRQSAKEVPEVEDQFFLLPQEFTPIRKQAQKVKYYSNWKFSATHILTSIPGFQTASIITKKLNLTETNRNLAHFDRVNRHGPCKKSGKSLDTFWEKYPYSINSSYNAQNHLNWRLKAFDDFNNKGSVHYTSVFTLSISAWEKLRDQLLRSIEAQRDMIHKSDSEELYCFCCDLFQPFQNL